MGSRAAGRDRHGHLALGPGRDRDFLIKTETSIYRGRDAAVERFTAEVPERNGNRHRVARQDLRFGRMRIEDRMVVATRGPDIDEK
jgi:hypothetical protein